MTLTPEQANNVLQGIKSVFIETTRATVIALEESGPHQATLAWEVPGEDILCISIVKLPKRYGKEVVRLLDQAVEDVVTQLVGKPPTEVLDHTPSTTVKGNA